MRYFSMLLLMSCTVGLDSTYVVEKDLEGDDSGISTDIDGNTTGSNTGGSSGENTGGETVVEDCGDGIDNDGDTWVDCSDSDCFSSADCLQDNDGDGFLATNDCDDNDPTINPGAAEIANDGIDQNCDGEDYTTGSGSNTSGGTTTGGTTTGSTTGGTTSGGTSSGTTTGSTSGGTTGGSAFEYNCSDGIDDDLDGLIDCDDSDCYFDSYCMSTPYEICDDYMDNDGDGLYDCDDSDCALDWYCYSGGTTGGTTGGSGSCNDTCIFANDGFCDDASSSNWSGSAFFYCDPGTDCSDCGGTIGSTSGGTTGGSAFEYNCSDGIDDDVDGLIDCDDSDCSFDSWCTSGGTTGSTSGGGTGCLIDGSPSVVSTSAQSASYNYQTPITAAKNITALSCGGSSDPEEYIIEWTAQYSGCATMNTEGMLFDTVMSVFDDCPSFGTELFCNDDDDSGIASYSYASVINMNVEAGTTYYIVVEGYYSAPTSGDVDITQDLLYDCSGNSLAGTTTGGTTGAASGGTTGGLGSCDDTCIYANDGTCDDLSSLSWSGDYSTYCDSGTDCSDCSGTTTGGTTGSTSGGTTTCLVDSTLSSTIGYVGTQSTSNEIVPSCNSGNIVSEYILDYIPTDSGCANFDTIGMYADTVLAVYDDCPTTGFELACDDNSGSATLGTSDLSVDVVAGNTYYVVLEGNSSDLTYGYISSSLDIGASCSGTSTGGTTGGLGTCDDTCYAANDGYCDDMSSANYNGTSYCYEGTDCSDCSVPVVSSECCYTLDMICGVSGWGSAGLYSYINSSYNLYHTPSICSVFSTSGSWLPSDSESIDICIDSGDSLELELMIWDTTVDIDFSLSDENGTSVLSPLIENMWTGSVICSGN